MSEATLNMSGKLSDEQAQQLMSQYTVLQHQIYVKNVELSALVEHSNKLVDILKAHQEQLKKDAENGTQNE